MKRVELKISGMTCEHCEEAVKDALAKTGAMVESVSFDDGSAICCFNPNQITNEAFMKCFIFHCDKNLRSFIFGPPNIFR